MRACLLSLLLCLASASAFAEPIFDPSEKEEYILTPEYAAKHLGERITVRAPVAEVHLSKSGDVQLNFYKPFPNQEFSADVLAKKTPKLLANGWQWLKEFEGKHVVVIGVVALESGKPKIIITAKADVVEDR